MTKEVNISPSVIDEDALKYILSMPQGRKVLWDILGFAGLNRQPRVHGDSEATFFNCGSLNVGLAIYADCLLVSPDLTAMMTKEQGNADRKLPEPDTEPKSKPSPGPDNSGPGSSEDSGLGFTRYPGAGVSRD